MRTEQELREHLARNLTYYRRKAGFTQTELAERINYSDKSVSKWERGDGLPDVYVLTRLADIFDVTVGDLLSEKIRKGAPGGKRQKAIITLLAVGLVWLCAMTAFFFGKIFAPDADLLWMVFIGAIPVSAIVLIVLSHLWWRLWLRVLSVSVLIWGATLTIHLPLQVENITLIYILAGVLQVLVCLWYLLVYSRRKIRQLPLEETPQSPPDINT